ncbi:MAG: orotate phosphoribosyltransferase [Dehalococcoidales bacterium]|nr:MAG: orotate phosphoribosyltransferase [Dehalococcoidales bacterium]
MTNNIEEMFEKAGAVLKGHFLLASGRHSPVYWEKFRILQRPDYVTRLCSMIADHFRGQRIDLVAGPTTGGIILAFEVARQLSTRAIYAERAEGGGRTFRRSQTITPGERVLIVDDVLTGGGSIRDVIDTVTTLQGSVIGVGVLLERSEKSVDFRVPLFSCLRVTAQETYSPEDCPQCTAQVPLVKPGGGQ